MIDRRGSRRAFLSGGLGLAFAPPAEPFARRMTTLSEPESGPPADNLVSNEDSYPRVATELARAAPRGAVYLGVGPDQNFTVLAHARPTLGLILDHRRRNALLHLIHKAIFTLSADRAAYLARLTARAPARPLPASPTADDLVAAFGPASFDRARLERAVAEVAATLKPLGVVTEADLPALATIQAKLAGPGLDARFLALRMYPTLARMIRATDRDGRPAHVLANDSLYQTVRDLQRDDRVIPLVANLAGDAALPRIADWLTRSALNVGVIYVSDVEFFLLRAGKFVRYLANLERLPWSEGALIVRTSTREIASPERVPGDSATTIVRPVDRFLADGRAGRIRSVDDLFRPVVNAPRPA